MKTHKSIYFPNLHHASFWITGFLEPIHLLKGEGGVLPALVTTPPQDHTEKMITFDSHLRDNLEPPIDL